MDPAAAHSSENQARNKGAVQHSNPSTYVPMDYLVLWFIRFVRSTDRLAGGRSVAVLRCTIDRVRLRCVFFRPRGIVSWITSLCLLIGPPSLIDKSNAERDAHIEELDRSGKAFGGMLGG